jgi:hypothetical protein
MAVAGALAVAMVAMVMAATAHCAVEDTGPVASTEEFPQWLSLLAITSCFTGSNSKFLHMKKN